LSFDCDFSWRKRKHSRGVKKDFIQPFLRIGFKAKKFYLLKRKSIPIFAMQ
jgi:hypothetical protein